MDQLLEHTISNPRIAQRWTDAKEYKPSGRPRADRPLLMSSEESSFSSVLMTLPTVASTLDPLKPDWADLLNSTRHRKSREGRPVSVADDGPSYEHLFSVLDAADRFTRQDEDEEHRLPTSFPLLKAIERTDGKVAQVAGERMLFKATALRLRHDFDVAFTDVRTPSEGWVLEPGTIDFRNHWKPPSNWTNEDSDDGLADPTMIVDREMKFDVDTDKIGQVDSQTGEPQYGTGELRYKKLRRSRSTITRELREVWEPYKAPEMRMVSTTYSARVDNDDFDHRRDTAPELRRVRSQQILEILMDTLGTLFPPLRDACHYDEDLLTIGEKLGSKGKQATGAASIVLRLALQRAADVYHALDAVEAGDRTTPGWWKGIGALRSTMAKKGYCAPTSANDDSAILSKVA